GPLIRGSSTVSNAPRSPERPDMTPSRAVLTTGAIAASAALVLSGCRSGASGAESGELSVVTSTNVYADIVSQVAGDFAEVTAVIDDPNQDPHSYEAPSQYRVNLTKAVLAVEMGSGYDAFRTTMLESPGPKSPPSARSRSPVFPGPTTSATNPTSTRLA